MFYAQSQLLIHFGLLPRQRCKSSCGIPMVSYIDRYLDRSSDHEIKQTCCSLFKASQIWLWDLVVCARENILPGEMKADWPWRAKPEHLMSSEKGELKNNHDLVKIEKRDCVHEATPYYMTCRSLHTLQHFPWHLWRHAMCLWLYQFYCHCSCHLRVGFDIPILPKCPSAYCPDCIFPEGKEVTIFQRTKGFLQWALQQSNEVTKNVCNADLPIMLQPFLKT